MQAKKLNEEYDWVQGDDGLGRIARKSKLLCAAGTFNDECVNIRHFVEVKLELVPRVLEFMQDVNFVGCRVDMDRLQRLALKNIFELMKNIAAPLLPTQKKGKSNLKRKIGDA